MSLSVGGKKHRVGGDSSESARAGATPLSLHKSGGHCNSGALGAAKAVVSAQRRRRARTLARRHRVPGATAPDSRSARAAATGATQAAKQQQERPPFTVRLEQKQKTQPHPIALGRQSGEKQ